MKALEHIDGFILNGFERFSHFMQRTFGTTSVDLERFCMAGSVLFCLLREPKLYGWASAGFLLVFATGAFACTYIPRDHAPGTMNPNKLKHQLTRPLTMLMCGIFLWNDIQKVNFWWEFWRCADYFNACDDLPPGESRVRKFVNSISAGFRQPVPVATFRLTETSK